MKNFYVKNIKPVVSDRPIFAILLTMVVFAIIFLIYFTFRLSPVDFQIPIRYSSFGTTYFYSGPWFNQLVFLGLGFIFLIFHPALLIKIYTTSNRSFTIIFGIASVVVLVFSAILLHRITGASLGI